MEPNKRVRAVTEQRPQRSLLGPPPLIPGEKLVDYQELAQRIAATVKPKDMLEEILVRDFVDLTWEIRRMRRLKAGFLTSVQSHGVQRVLTEILSYDEGRSALADAWAARDPQAIKQVDDLLSAKGLSMDLAVARALASNIGPFERIDAMISNLEARRNAALRELERRRASLALALRRATDDVIDAEFEDVAPAHSSQRDVA
jgi:hypothetical protein